jgi:hypothetical protein
MNRRSAMKTKMTMYMVVVVLTLVGVNSIFAAENVGPSAPGSAAGGGFGGADETIQAEILKIEGDKYIVRDSGGNRVSFRVNEQTKMDISPRVGDRIEAVLTEGGQAKLIKKGTAAGSTK